MTFSSQKTCKRNSFFPFCCIRWLLTKVSHFTYFSQFSTHHGAKTTWKSGDNTFCPFNNKKLKTHDVSVSRASFPFAQIFPHTRNSWELLLHPHMCLCGRKKEKCWNESKVKYKKWRKRRRAKVYFFHVIFLYSGILCTFCISSIY